MTVEAPLHVERRDATRQRHPVDGAVTGAAADALRDVDAVIEVDETRQVVDTIPFERLPARVRLAQRREHRGVVEKLGMARHARRERRDAREGRGLDRRVAVAAIDAVVADVVLMAERDRLLDRVVLRRVAARVDAVHDGRRNDARKHEHGCDAQNERKARREDL
jgi:hypothetical protein